LFETSDEVLAICLLDKIQQTESVMQKLIKMQFDRIVQHKPMTFTEPGTKMVTGVSTDKSLQNRVSQEFAIMLTNYKKEGHHEKFRDLFFILEELDKVAEAFDCLNNVSTTDDLKKALTLL
jgi:hypothetical protein